MSLISIDQFPEFVEAYPEMEQFYDFNVTILTPSTHSERTLLATPAQIEEQVNFERDAINVVSINYANNTKDLEDKQYASATAYGSASYGRATPFVVQRIEETKNRILRR